ncbi:MAG: HesA/MoeB/ThiF family protein [Oscillospiraceae bacterium]|nr:HesA/MoeB/ThiF family protein [Oscillospiraceae bacterium]
MDARYIRNIPALTEQECAVLRTKKIAVIGCGGLGGHLIDLLARIGIGAILAVDGDVFEESNLNRQLLSEVSLLGKSKAEAALQRIARINPNVQAEAAVQFLDQDNALSLIAGCDAVLDALDNIPSRRILASACEQAGIPYVYGAIQGWVAQAAVSIPGDHLIHSLYPEQILIRDKSALSFTCALCASMQASLCVKLLTGRPVETGTVYYFDLLNQEFETIPTFS